MGGDIEEYPFLFMNTPVSLQILASVEMALMVWRCKYANTSHLYKKPIIFFQQQLSCEEVLVVPVPRRIRAQIDEKIVNIGKELREWIDFHSDQDFLNAHSTKAFRKCFKRIVVDFSGSISYKASALNMLNSDEFSNVRKYKIACTFCSEDQVKRFWPLVANKFRIDVYFEYDKRNLSYWNNKMKSGENSITDTASVKRLIKTAAFGRNDAAAFDYFCKMLPDHERVSEFISLLSDDDSYHPAVIHSLFLRTLNRVQAEQVFKREACSFFHILTRSGENFQYAHRSWTLMGHLILENKSHFYNVVSELWTSVFFPNHLDGLNYAQYGQINSLLLEIWSHASNEMKAFVSNGFLREKLFDFFDGAGKFPRPTSYGHDMTFILEITSKLRHKDKEDMWLENWRALALRSKPEYLEQFMRLCLPNDDAIEIFKIKIANFEDLFESLIEEGFYSDLKEYVKFCSKDPKQFQQLGRKVLGWNLPLILLNDDEKFAKFEWFVGELFSNIPKDVEEFKTKMISSDEALENLLVAREADKISSKDYSRIIRRFVTNEGELQQVKRKLFEHCRTYPFKATAETFNAGQWQEFLEWCTADHEEISAFKRSLNVDLIFLKRLKDHMNGKCNFGGLDFLDNILKWYFGNEEDAKKFKLEKVKNYKKIDILRVEMENGFIYVEGLLYRLLVWLFHNNTKNVGKFCKTCNIDIRRRQIKARVNVPST